MTYNTIQVELEYWLSKGIDASIFDDECCNWIVDKSGDGMPSLIHNDYYTFNVMKNHEINVEFCDRYVSAMARDGINPVCVHYADRGYLDNRSVVNLAIILAATEKNKEKK